MKTLLIIILLMSGIRSQAQLSTNQYRQVTSMIATATKPLINDITILKAQVKALQDSLLVIKNSIVPFNKLSFKSPLEAIKDTIPNSYIIFLKQ